MDKSFFIIMGLAFGLLVGLALDMALNKGNIAAKHIHHEFPECSSTCHG